MKIILSRKGFDSTSGGMAGPILPDGTLLSLPIPSDDGTIGYDEIFYEEKSYLEIISELNPRIGEKLQSKKCHLDPDIENRYGASVMDWTPAFGQADLAEKHLEKQNVSKGDIFLFYGWFRETDYDENGKLRFVRKLSGNANTIDKHVIFGYMEVGQKIEDVDSIKKLYPFHPHAQEKYSQLPNNVLYIPTSVLSANKQVKGYGCLKYQPKNLLTKKGHKRSEWALPNCFRNVEISYHENDNFGWIEGNDYFKSAYRGQEFVIEATDEIMKWAMDIIGNGSTEG